MKANAELLHLIKKLNNVEVPTKSLKLAVATTHTHVNGFCSNTPPYPQTTKPHATTPNQIKGWNHNFK